MVWHHRLWHRFEFVLDYELATSRIFWIMKISYLCKTPRYQTQVFQLASRIRPHLRAFGHFQAGQQMTDIRQDA